jgi:hypothetical protein
VAYFTNSKYCDTIPFDFGEMGRWWGNNPKERRQEEMDIVIISVDKDHMMLGECKYRNEKVNESVLEQLMEISVLLTAHKKYFALFSKS